MLFSLAIRSPVSVMFWFLFPVLLTLHIFTGKAFSNIKSSSPSTLDFRHFAAWDFGGPSTDSCTNNLYGRPGDELGPTTGTQVRSRTQDDSNQDILTALDVYPLKNTSLELSKNYNDENFEGLHKLHLLTSAQVAGAVCLDGSPPAIYLRQGSGPGKSKWIICFEGGAWCNDPDSCYKRSFTVLGSSKCFPKFLRLEGLLSNQARYNPDFFDWTSVFVRYCDGASFTGDRAKPLKVNNKPLYFRGHRILDAVLDELIRRGIDQASEIILTGRSAGGLAAIIHADYIGERFHRVTSASFRVLSDAGFFLDEPSLNGSLIVQSVFRQLYSLHNSSTRLNRVCLGAQKPDEGWRCLFPQFSLPYVTSQIFLLNSLYDTWQIAYLSDVPCVYDMKTCSSAELSYIMNFREKTLHGLHGVLSHSNSIGVFADSCFVHAQSVLNNLWTKIRVENVAACQAFADWYRGSSMKRLRIDKPYPSNPTCPNKPL